MKTSLLLSLCLFSLTALADFSNSCIWTGEELIQKAVVEQGTNWLEAVYELHLSGGPRPATFEGVGSCRFVPRNLGDSSQDVINGFLKNGVVIIPTRAYLKLENGQTKFVLPSAGYAFVTNVLKVKKDFYSLDDNGLCEQQMQDMVDLGQSTSSIDLHLVDVEYKTDSDGVSAVINGNSPIANLFGVCHFHNL